jgi:hypothetical protein
MTADLNRIARVAGLTYIATMVIVVVSNFGIHARLVVRGDLAQTARNIAAHEWLYRTNIACDLLYAIGVLILTAALFVILEQTGRTLATLAAFFRVMWAITWVLMAIGRSSAMRAPTAENFRAIVEVYYLGLPFFALASTVCAWLWLRSRLIPRGLAAYGVAASAWCVFCAFAFIVVPDFAKSVNLWWFDTPMAVFEIATSFVLVLRGLPAASARTT